MPWDCHCDPMYGHTPSCGYWREPVASEEAAKLLNESLDKLGHDTELLAESVHGAWPPPEEAPENPVLDVIERARAVVDASVRDYPGKLNALRAALIAYDLFEPTGHMLENDVSHGWIIVHPLTCRPNLAGCTANRWWREAKSYPDEGHTYMLVQTEGRWEIGERIA